MHILFDPDPRSRDEIFDAATADRFFGEHEVTEVDPAQRDADYARHLPRTEILISQQGMDRARLDAAPHLRAIFNVETNFLPNIDYETCFRRGIHVLAPSSVFAMPVAEMGLGMALSLLRGIHTGHMDFVRGSERYGLDGNSGAGLLSGARIGLIGYGDLGRALHHLLRPFCQAPLTHDPWLPDGYLRRQGVVPVSLPHLLSECDMVFVCAAITTENRHALEAAALRRMPDGAALVLLSRAAILDFDAMAQEAASGRLRFATDVFPQEPVAPGDPLRAVPNILFSAHRAGALVSALHQIGALVLEDIGQIARGLPPVACKRAERETVMRLQSMPVARS